jgi:hypothetical protein
MMSLQQVGTYQMPRRGLFQLLLAEHIMERGQYPRLESEVSELMKAISHAYVRGRFHSYSG